ncbi:MAG: GAF domain-containing protein [Chloroflexi bacterium]|nr:GAF domain-containing protein [Chloroflexota bacterium]
MSDTATNNMNPLKPTQSGQEQLRQLKQEVAKLDDLLRVQQSTLRPYAVGLPADALRKASGMTSKMESLTLDLLNRQIELRQLRALAQTTALINSTLDTDEVLTQVMDTVIQLTGAERGYIMLRDQPGGQMEFRIARGIDQEQLQREDFIISNTIINEVANTGQPVLTDNARSDPRYQQQESIVGYQLRSILAVPLKVQSEVIGVVYCDNRALTALFKDSELNMLKAFADQAAVAIQNARLFEATRAQLAQISAARALMDNIFTSIASGLITLDGENIITLFNPAAEAITRVGSERAIDMYLHEVLPGLAELLADQLERVRASGDVIALELEIALRDQIRVWNVHLSPLRDPADARGIALVLDDLTEQKERESQLAQVQRYLPSALVENMRSTDLSVLAGQEREITVLFADVRGFTSFSELLEPEELMQIINEYLSVASDAINLYEGVVDKYLGDAVTGLFNTQLNPQGDHAVRAVRAALSMVYDVLALHEIMPEDSRLFYGIGIHTGMATLGNVGGEERQEFAAIGDAVELSKLLQENAGRGEIIISEATLQYVKDDFEFEALTPHKTKGRTDFTVMYRLTGRKKK